MHNKKTVYTRTFPVADFPGDGDLVFIDVLEEERVTAKRVTRKKGDVEEEVFLFELTFDQARRYTSIKPVMVAKKTLTPVEQKWKKQNKAVINDRIIKKSVDIAEK